MAKKGSLPLIYMIGMALVVIGFICPVFDLFIGTLNGFDFINFNNLSVDIETIGALLIFFGGILGIIFYFLDKKKTKTYKLVALILSLLGGTFLLIANKGFFDAGLGDFFLDIATWGFYFIIIGWILGIIGSITNNLIYLIGMALVVVGFCCPIFSFFGGNVNGFYYLSDFGFGITIGALFIIIGAVLGLVFCFVDIRNSELFKLIGILISIAGGILLIIGYSDNMFSKGIGKFLIDIATYGFYMILAGWIVGVVGYVMKK